MRSITVRPLLLLICLVGNTAVRADEPDPNELIAKGHYQLGVNLYNDNKFAEAAREFEAARAAKALPAFDYNIARSLAHLGDAAGAIAAYDRYLASTPPPTDTDDIRGRIAILRAKLPPPVPAAAAVAPSPTADEGRFHRLRVPIAIAGAGCALLIASLAAALVSQSKRSDLQQHCSADGLCDPSVFPDAQQTIDSGRNAAIAADVFLAVGLVVVASAVIVGVSLHRRPAGALRVQLGSAGAGFAWGGF